MATVDVTVMGAGIFGLSVAYVCARRGARVRVIERRGVGAGASGGIVGALAPHTPENWNAKKQFQLESLFAAEPFWAEIETFSGLGTGFGRVGRLQPVTDVRGLDLARQRGRNASTLWQGKAAWDVVRTGTDPGWEPVSLSGWLIRDTLSARLHPRRACESLAGAIHSLGGEIVIGAGRAQGAVVWATGHEGLRDLGQALERPVGTGVKGQALLLDRAALAKPQLFAEGLHIVPHEDGTTAIGSTSEREFEDGEATDKRADALLDRAVRICPALAGAAVLGRWAGVRPRARSRAPLLGAWPGRPGHFVANGGFKIGFGMAPKVAEVMADLVLEEYDTIPPEFRLEAGG